LNRFGRKKTEPNRTEINRFEPVFGLVRFKKLKKNSVWLFILVQNRIELEMLSRHSFINSKFNMEWVIEKFYFFFQIIAFQVFLNIKLIDPS